jgi:hypothetical protein
MKLNRVTLKRITFYENKDNCTKITELPVHLMLCENGETPCYSVFLEKLIIAQIVKDLRFSHLYEI